MRGSEALEAEEDMIIEPEGILAPSRSAKMNGTNGANGGKNGGACGDVKYPANCAMRLGSTPGSDENGDDPYEVKQNKKIVRILTVLIYVFTVSFGKKPPKTDPIFGLIFHLFQAPFYFHCTICSCGTLTKAKANKQHKFLMLKVILRPRPLLPS